MFNRVCVDGDHANGGGPLMVLLVEVLVEGWVVEQPARGGERERDRDRDRERHKRERGKERERGWKETFIDQKEKCSLR